MDNKMKRAYEMGLLLGRMGAQSKDVNAALTQRQNELSDEEVVCHLNGVDDGFAGL